MTLRSRLAGWFVAGLALASAKLPVLACATCFGATDSKLAEGMNWGILSLLCVVAVVLGTITSFFVFIARRAPAVEAELMVSDSINSNSSKV